MVLDADVPGYFRNTEFSEELTFMNSFISYLLMCNMVTTKTANQLQLYAINWNPHNQPYTTEKQLQLSQIHLEVPSTSHQLR